MCVVSTCAVSGTLCIPGTACVHEVHIHTYMKGRQHVFALKAINRDKNKRQFGKTCCLPFAYPRYIHNNKFCTGFRDVSEIWIYIYLCMSNLNRLYTSATVRHAYITTIEDKLDSTQIKL